MNKSKLLKLTLWAGAAYYFIGAVVHFFGLTLFPFYDSGLYTPYHDSIIALTALIFSSLFVVVANDPKKNIDILKLITVWVFLASIFSIAIIWKVDFATLGGPGKEGQTVTEGILGIVYTAILIAVYPKNTSDKNIR